MAQRDISALLGISHQAVSQLPGDHSLFPFYAVESPEL
jgi:hypothetical protein